MDYTVFIPVLISFALSVIMGPVIIPVLRRLKMGQTEREDGVQSHLKKGRHPDHGWCDHPSVDRDHICVLYPQLPQDHSDLVCDDGIWPDRISGRLPEGGDETLRRPVSEAEDGAADRSDCCVRILSGEIYGRIPCHADPVFRRTVSEYRLACDPAVILCGDRNSQRRELYRWAGRPGFQRDGAGRYIFHRGGAWN